MKIRRFFVQKKYAATIEAMYEEWNVNVSNFPIRLYGVAHMNFVHTY